MGEAQVDLRPTTVHKVYPEHLRFKAQHETFFYTELDWATPKLLYSGEGWLETERLTPILELPKDLSRKYEKPLRDLVSAVNDAGFWHCDVCLVNVVIHPMRGPLLVDWENARASESEISYDLYGAELAGAEVTYEPHRPNGVWWDGPWRTCPGVYWA